MSCWDPHDACCLSPLELFSPDAPETCANHTSDSITCAHSIDCIARFESLGLQGARVGKGMPGYKGCRWCCSTSTCLHLHASLPLHLVTTLYSCHTCLVLPTPAAGPTPVRPSSPSPPASFVPPACGAPTTTPLTQVCMCSWAFPNGGRGRGCIHKMPETCPSVHSAHSPPGPTAGWCTSVRDVCYDYSNDPEACTTAPQCRAVPRCSRSYCRADDQCCLTQGATECNSKPGCATSGWCGLTTSECWYQWDEASCAAQGNTCMWQTYTPDAGSGPVSGWCSVASDPCAPHHAYPVACASVLDPRRGIPLCKYQARVHQG